MIHALTSLVMAASLVAPATAPAPAPTEAATPAPAPAPTAAAAPAAAASAPTATPTVTPASGAPTAASATVAPTPTPGAASPAPTSVSSVNAPGAPPTTVVVNPVTVAPAPSQPAVTAPRLDPEHERQQRVATGLIAGGGSVLIIGGAALLFVALPARARYLSELEDAEDAHWITEREQPAADARRMRTVMTTSALAGASLAVVGTVVMSVGLSRRNRLRRSAAATLSLAPAVGGGHYGAGATVRF